MVRTTVPPELVASAEEVIGHVPDGGLWEKGSVAITDIGSTCMGDFAKLLTRVVELALPMAARNVPKEDFVSLIERQNTHPL